LAPFSEAVSDTGSMEIKRSITALAALIVFVTGVSAAAGAGGEPARPIESLAVERPEPQAAVGIPAVAQPAVALGAPTGELPGSDGGNPWSHLRPVHAEHQGGIGAGPGVVGAFKHAV